MKIELFTVGRLRDSHLKAVESEYEKRLKPFCKFDIVEHKTEESALAASQGKFLVALDERGRQMTSPAFAENVIAPCRERSQPVVFLIGGAEGHSDATRQRADVLLAFGEMTLAHRLARVVLVEQIYRAFTILAGHPYHK